VKEAVALQFTTISLRTRGHLKSNYISPIVMFTFNIIQEVESVNTICALAAIISIQKPDYNTLVYPDNLPTISL